MPAPLLGGFPSSLIVGVPHSDSRGLLFLFQLAFPRSSPFTPRSALLIMNPRSTILIRDGHPFL